MLSATHKSLAVLSVAGLLAGCDGRVGAVDPADTVEPLGGPDRYSQTFTTTEDFQAGLSNGVSDDSAGQLQMSIGQTAFQTPYMWIPNSTENSITLIDTMKNEVIGTYPLVSAAGETCWNPSRTTVDFNWDVWVGCRGTNSYINGRMGRSIQEVDNKVMKVSFRTGKVLLSVQVGNAPRAVAIDANNHVWVGASADDTVWEIDGDTGQCYRGNGCPKPAIAVPDFPYGAVVDQDGRLWLSHNKVTTDDQDQVSMIDTLTGAVLGIYGPFNR
ncbi:MAG: YncE family protein, partial [Myxococcaceae bacterium]